MGGVEAKPDKPLFSSGESHTGNALSVCDSDAVCGEGELAGLSCECAHCTMPCSDAEACRLSFRNSANAEFLDRLRCVTRPPVCAENVDNSVAQGIGTCELTCDSNDDCVQMLGSNAECLNGGTCRLRSVELGCPLEMALVFGGTVGDAGESVETFCMSKTEVTVEQYRACSGSACEPTTQGNAFESDADLLPIDFVSPLQATQYCEQMGGRLPTAAQWRWAAQNGNYGSRYPWGATFEAEDVDRVCSLNTSQACNVASSPRGDTLAGLADMSGNVAEIVAEDSDYCVAGGSFAATSGETTDTSALQVTQCVAFVEPSDQIGFRCVTDPVPLSDGGM